MSYTMHSWKSGQAGGTPITAAWLNEMEAGINAAANNIITSGPYTLDPKRAPAGSLVAIGDNDVVLTHIGTRFNAAATGDVSVNDTAVDSTKMKKGGTGTATVAATGGLFGKCLNVSAVAAADYIATSFTMPTGVREFAFSAIVHTPRPTTDCNILSIDHTSNALLIIAAYPAANGAVSYIVNDATTTGWDYTAPGVTPGQYVRVEANALLADGAGASKLTVRLYVVAADGTETQLGTTYSNAAIATDLTGASLKQVNFGRLNSNAGSEGLTYSLDSLRVSYGTGANGVVLVDERKYPDPVAVA